MYDILKTTNQDGEASGYDAVPHKNSLPHMAGQNGFALSTDSGSMEPAIKQSVCALLCVVSCIMTSNAKGDICAPGCRCYSKTKSIECAGSEINDIPRSLPRDTQVLNIHDCTIARLKKDSLDHLLVLVKLSIESCLLW